VTAITAAGLCLEASSSRKQPAYGGTEESVWSDSTSPSFILMLVFIKLLHTVVWALLAGCILALPVAAARRRFDRVVILSAVILIECAVIAFNRGRCPLTDLAGQFTSNRADNFDIYLPLWLARYNKTIFGTWFVIHEVFAFYCWRNARVTASR
jgi:hypothetical protein